MVVPFLETYGQVGRGRVAVCEDSFRTVTIAVNQGSAAARLRASRGEPLVISRLVTPGAPGPVVLPPEPNVVAGR
jgi:S-adenosylmethionine hydrolase